MESHEKAMLGGGTVGTLTLSGFATAIVVITHMPEDWGGVFSFTCGGVGWMIGMWLGVRLNERREEGTHERKNKAYERERAERHKTLVRKMFADELKNIDPFRKDKDDA